MITPRKRQAGAALIVSLFMLIVLTLLAVAAVNTNSIDLRIARNLQTQQEVEAAALEAIEQVLSSAASFKSPQQRTITVNALNVEVSPPQCLGERHIGGPHNYSAQFPLAPKETDWEVSAAVQDPTTGARARIIQGVTIRFPADHCP